MQRRPTRVLLGATCAYLLLLTMVCGCRRGHRNPLLGETTLVTLLPRRGALTTLTVHLALVETAPMRMFTWDAVGGGGRWTWPTCSASATSTSRPGSARTTMMEPLPTRYSPACLSALTLTINLARDVLPRLVVIPNSPLATTVAICRAWSTIRALARHLTFGMGRNGAQRVLLRLRR